LSAPAPLAFGHTAPPEPVHVHENAMMPAGSASAIVVLVTATVPVFCTVTV
jgi:hypothetical protein